MIKQETPVQIFFIICLIGVLCYVISACINRNMQVEAAYTSKGECTMGNVSDVGSFVTVRIKCPEKSYRCFKHTQSSYGASISCVPMGM